MIQNAAQHWSSSERTFQKTNYAKALLLVLKNKSNEKAVLLGRPFSFNRIFYDKPSDKKSHYNQLVSYTKEGQDSS